MDKESQMIWESYRGTVAVDMAMDQVIDNFGPQDLQLFLNRLADWMQEVVDEDYMSGMEQVAEHVRAAADAMSIGPE